MIVCRFSEFYRNLGCSRDLPVNNIYISRANRFVELDDVPQI